MLSEKLDLVLSPTNREERRQFLIEQEQLDSLIGMEYVSSVILEQEIRDSYVNSIIDRISEAGFEGAKLEELPESRKVAQYKDPEGNTATYHRVVLTPEGVRPKASPYGVILQVSPDWIRYGISLRRDGGFDLVSKGTVAAKQLERGAPKESKLELSKLVNNVAKTIRQGMQNARIIYVAQQAAMEVPENEKEMIQSDAPPESKKKTTILAWMANKARKIYEGIKSAGKTALAELKKGWDEAGKELSEKTGISPESVANEALERVKKLEDKLREEPEETEKEEETGDNNIRSINTKILTSKYDVDGNIKNVDEEWNPHISIDRKSISYAFKWGKRSGIEIPKVIVDIEDNRIYGYLSTSPENRKEIDSIDDVSEMMEKVHTSFLEQHKKKKGEVSKAEEPETITEPEDQTDQEI